jgi:hypothetical protein
MRVKIADLVECPEGMEMFLYLADRTALLFPEEGRVVCRVIGSRVLEFCS